MFQSRKRMTTSITIDQKKRVSLNHFLIIEYHVPFSANHQCETLREVLNGLYMISLDESSRLFVLPVMVMVSSFVPKSEKNNNQDFNFFLNWISSFFKECLIKLNQAVYDCMCDKSSWPHICLPMLACRYQYRVI